MPTFTADQLAEWTLGRWHSCPAGWSAGRFVQDSRKLQAGDVFIALKTNARDGHDFIKDAKDKGAAGALVSTVDESVDLPQLKVDDPLLAFQDIAKEWRELYKGMVIGITGSSGKTSTKELLLHLLGEDDTHATEANFNNLIGVPLTLTQIDPEKHKFAIIEAGISELREMDKLVWMIQPDAAIITNVGPAHLEQLQTLETISVEKAKLGHAVKQGFVVFPHTCCEFDSFRRIEGRVIISAQGDDDVLCDDPQSIVPFEIGPIVDRSRKLTIYRESIKPLVFSSEILSAGMLSNAALSIITAMELDVSVEKIQERLKLWKVAENRGEIIETEKQNIYLDCYNANPASMLDALETFQQLWPDTKSLYVLGCMNELGEYAEGYHYDIGAALNLGEEDVLIAIGEYADEYAEGALSLGVNKNQIRIAGSAEEVSDYVHEFKGSLFIKGSRSYQLESLLPVTVDRKTLKAC